MTLLLAQVQFTQTQFNFLTTNMDHGQYLYFNVRQINITSICPLHAQYGLMAIKITSYAMDMYISFAATRARMNEVTRPIQYPEKIFSS